MKKSGSALHSKLSYQGLLIFVGGLLLSGCATVYPMKQYVVAREAVESARDIEAARYAPGLWYKAEEAFRRAKRDFEEKDFKSAMEGFEVARMSAEKAENSARFQRQKAGEEVP